MEPPKGIELLTYTYESEAGVTGVVASPAGVRRRVPQSATGCRNPSRSIDRLRGPNGFRPRRRAQDAIAETHQFTSRSL